MTVKRFLIFAPIILLTVLLQSYFWVPSYEEQTRGNPDRLNDYIIASIGDAAILNPVLSADSASSDINNLIFEGLLDRDKELRLRGRLARSWEIFEEAFFHVNEQAVIPGLGRVGTREVADHLRRLAATAGQEGGEVQQTLANIKAIEVEPGREFEVVWKREKDGDKSTLQLQVKAPPRFKLVLGRVDQDLFTNLAKILGPDYFSSFPAADFIRPVGEKYWDGSNPAPAEILPAIEHNPVIVFHLREEVKFHDGHIFDAGDVKFTFEAIMNPKNLSPRIPDYEPVKEVVVLDPFTVRIVYKRLYSPALATWNMGILPEHLLNETALRREAARLGRKPEGYTMRQSEFNRRPVGCGPFVFQQWQADQYIILDAFGDYWEGAPNYHRYVYRIIPDLLTQEMEFYAGTVDSYGVQPHQVERLGGDPRFQAFSGLTFGYTYIGYNMRRPPFDDVRIRKALGMAIDVNKIIEFVLYDQGERITGPFAKQTDYYDHGIKPLPYDPEGALALLAEAGFRRNNDGWLEKDGRRLAFTLITNSGNDLRKAMLTVAQKAWKQLGIDVRTDILEWSIFIQERVNKLDFDALILGWSMDIEPDLYQIWHSSQTNPYQLNFVGFRNRAADELIVKIRQEYDHEKQVEYCHRLHELIAREQPYTFLYVGKWTAVLDRRIVIRRQSPAGEFVFEPIRPTKTGIYTYDFNRWIKLPEPLLFGADNGGGTAR
jgi:ABC-type transport system substrate-binding protein